MIADYCTIIKDFNKYKYVTYSYVINNIFRFSIIKVKINFITKYIIYA